MRLYGSSKDTVHLSSPPTLALRRLTQAADNVAMAVREFNGPASPLIQYLHNGLTPPDSLTTGPLWVRDYLDTLVSAGADRLAIPGMRLDGDTFVNDDGAGTALYPSQQVRTRNGTVTQYTGDYKGMQVSPAMTNKVTCRKVNPVDTTGLSKTPEGTVDVVDDSAALADAGLDELCSSGKVYEAVLDPGGYAYALATVGNTNPHSARVYARIVSGDSAEVGLTSSTRPSFTHTTYAPVEQINKTPLNDTRQLIVFNNSASSVTVRFILPELIESPYLLDSPVVPLPADDALTSYTRAATVAEWDSANFLRTQGLALWGRFYPGAAGQTAHLLGCKTDADNLLEVTLTATTVKLNKIVAAAAAGPSVSYTHAKDTGMEYRALLTEQGMSLQVKQDAGEWSAWVDDTSADAKSDAVIASTFQLGADGGGAGQVGGTFPFTASAFTPAFASLAAGKTWVETNTQWNVLGGEA